MKLKPVVLLLFLVGACGSVSLDQQMAQSCSLWGSALNSFATMVRADKVTDGQIATIQGLRPSMRILCALDSPTDADLNELRRALRTANTMGAR